MFNAAVCKALENVKGMGLVAFHTGMKVLRCVCSGALLNQTQGKHFVVLCSAPCGVLLRLGKMNCL